MGRGKRLALGIILTLGLILSFGFSAKASLVNFFSDFAENLVSGVVTNIYEYNEGQLIQVTSLATGTVTHYANGHISHVDTLYVKWDMEGLRDYIESNGLEEALKEYFGVDDINDLTAAQILEFLAAPEEEGGAGLSEEEIQEIIHAYTSTEIATTTYEYDEEGKLKATHTPVVDENGNIVEGKQNTTYYNNGKIDYIEGWIYDSENDEWKEAKLVYHYDENGKLIKAEGNLALAPGISGQMLLPEDGSLNADGTIFFDSQGRMKEFGFGTGDNYEKRAEFNYDEKGRLSRVDIYNGDGEKVKALTYEYEGDNVSKVIVTEKRVDEEGNEWWWAVVSETQYIYGRHNQLLYTETLMDDTIETEFGSDYEEFKEYMMKSPYWNRVFSGMNDEEIEDTLRQLYKALCEGNLSVGGSIEINGITFSLVQEGEGSRLDITIDGKTYHFRHLNKTLTQQLGTGVPKDTQHVIVTLRTYYVFGKPFYTTRDVEVVGVEEGPGYDWDTMWGDPAATGNVYQDAQGRWHMKVIVWTNEEKTEWEEVDIILDLSLLDEDTRAEIEGILAEYAKSGENLTLYGLTSTGTIYEGTTLQVLGLGKGPFEEHPYDFI
ncbi:MAG: hypothetical protein B6D56_07005 [Candidatus Omnitrophica bacterium 4484_70.1]|nr:MAG: hypothetical protein B6D56_07005 [Candidatus Omnitrophica bacterium 4484_70.1]